MVIVEHTKLHYIPIEYTPTNHGLIATRDKKTVLVTDGKLVLVECKPEEALITCVEGIIENCYRLHKKGSFIAGKYLKPIIISLTEKFVPNEPVLCLDEIEHGWDNAYLKNGRGKGTCTQCKKILALPEHFSSEQLQMIVDAKLNGGDKLLVECNRYNPISFGDESTDIYSIKQNPHITIYPVENKEQYSKGDILTAFGHGFNIGQRNSNPILDADSVLTIAEKWFEQNVK